MKRLIPLLVVLGVAGLPVLAISFYESPDVPTDVSFMTFLPWDFVRNDSGIYTLAQTTPVHTAVDSLYRQCDGSWLFSVEAHKELAGTFYDPRDVILFDGTNYKLFFCGGPVGVPDGVDVDAVFLPDESSADLLLSFDVPVDLTALGGQVYEPADLIRFTPMPPPGCAGWSLDPLPFFDASVAGVPTWANVTGADTVGPLTVLTFDVPVDLGGMTYLPGQLVAWNGVSFSLLYADPAWPISSRHDALSFLPDPGTVPASPPTDKIHLGKTTGPLTVTVYWSASSSAGADDYGIYEGTLGSAGYSHTAKVCTDTGGDFQETFAPQAADSYYLVVPLNPELEGSYGTDSDGNQRPVGTVTCRPAQGLACP